LQQPSWPSPLPHFLQGRQQQRQGGSVMPIYPVSRAELRHAHLTSLNHVEHRIFDLIIVI
jgi:hypothetical protein